MAESAAMASGVAGRYATALFDLADEAGSLDAIASDVSKVKEALAASAELVGALDDPSISREALGGVAGSLAKKLGLSDTTTNFLGLMAANRRLSALPKALASFEALLADKRGEATASVIAAAPLSEAQKRALTDALAAAAGKKIHVTVDVDPDLIGGLVVKMGSKMIDASVRAKLSTLQHAMKEAG